MRENHNQQLHTINKKQFVFGLHWQITGKNKKQLKKLADEFDSQYFAQIKMDATDNQVGFVEPELSSLVKRKRTYSFAACIAKHYEQFPNLIAVFKVEEGVYSCVFTKENVIMPQGDLIGNHDEIKSAIIEMLSIIHDWDKIIAPEEFDLDAIESPDIESFFDEIKKISSNYKIRPVNVNYSKYLIAISIPLILYTVLGDIIVDTYLTKPEPSEPLVETKPILEPKIVYPWENLASNASFWAACEQPKVSFIVPGWKFNQYICNRQSISVSYLRQSGTALDIKKRFSPIFFSLDGQKAVWAQNLNFKPEPTKKIEIIDLLDLQRAYERLNQLAQANFFKLELSVGKKQPGVAGRANTSDTSVGKVFDELKFSIFSEILTAPQIFKLLDINGLYIKEVSINNPGSWQIKGVQYVKK